MEERIVRFITALRSSGLRISLSESTDAFKAIEEMGVKTREIFRLSLQTTLVKEAENLPTFDELFSIFFGNSDVPTFMSAADDITPEEAQQFAKGIEQLNDQLRRMLERLLKGEMLSQQELERLSKMIGLNQMDDMRYRDWMVQRMKRALHFKEVQEALRMLEETLQQLGMNKERSQRLVQLMQANQRALVEQLRQFSGQRIAENMTNKRKEESADALINRPFNTLSDKDMEILRKEVQHLASILRTRIALRMKKARSGSLDAKSTIRANLKHGNVPIQLKHREHSLKPKLVVICDVSTSMRYCSELMLSLLYHLQDQISKTMAFAFIDHLEFISPDFTNKDARQAVSHVLERMPSGYYNTDLGKSLQDFHRNYLEVIDGRTTLIVVGDGRNNYNDPQLDIFRKVTRRCRRAIWINPEASALWNSGDSDMLRYSPNCDVILTANTLAQLTSALDRLLIH